jgi:hypothetical protein
LEVLTLKEFVNFDSDGFKALLKGSSKLRVIQLVDVQDVTGYSDIFSECNLERLEHFSAIACPSFRGRDADFLRQRCPKIREVPPSPHY